MKEGYSLDKFRKAQDDLTGHDKRTHDELRRRDPQALERSERENSKTPGWRGVKERFSAGWDQMFPTSMDPLGVDDFFVFKSLHGEYLNETKAGQLELAQKEAEELNKEYDRLKNNLLKAGEEYKAFLETHIDASEPDAPSIADAA